MTHDERPLTEADLATCADEPIHIPGAIQPHGFLLATRGPELHLLQVSANVDRFLSRPAEALLGRPLSDVLGDHQTARLHQLLQEQAFPTANPVRFSLDGAAFDVSVHDSDGATVLELEPIEAAATGVAPKLAQAIRRLQLSTELAALHRTAVETVRELTGFARVMLYQFDEDGHGEVIAEAKAAELEPYLGLHYPATDIPPQARALYRRNWLRIIPDAGYTPVPLVPEQRPDTGRPLDMSDSVLRSVSPIHREYMANAGFAASMSISLLRGGELWGLIACVDGAPRRVPCATRQACATIGQLMSLQTSALLELRERESRRRRQTLLERLRQTLADADAAIPLALRHQPDALLELTGASAAALVRDGQIEPVGACPPAAELDGLLALVQEHARDGLFHCDRLAALHPPAARYPRLAAGMLAVLLPEPRRSAVLWFLPEQHSTVRWAGEPVKTVEETAAGLRLHPRRSFALWQQEVSGRSRRWQPTELWAAAELRRLAVERELARQVVLERIAVQERDELMGVVSHDLRTPLSVILIQTALMKRQLESAGLDGGGRLQQSLERVDSAGNRMRTLIQDLLLVQRFEAGQFSLETRPVPAQEAIDETLLLLGSLAEGKGVDLHQSVGTEAVIVADPDRLFQVLLNLVSNAVRHTPGGGRVALAAQAQAGWVEFSVSDTGPGIPPEQQLRCFQRYQSGPGGGGLGLGLYIARRIVEAHGGHIWLESRPGAGSSFRFRIPRQE